MSLNKRHFVPLLIVFLLILALGVAFLGPMLVSQPKGAPGMKHAPAPERVSAKGYIESEDEVELASRTTGTVEAIKVKKGDIVRSGQQLVVLDSAKIVAQIRMAQAVLRETEGRTYRSNARLEQARIDYEREKRLYEEDATTLAELERTEERYKAAQGDLFDMSQKKVGEAGKGRTAAVERAAAEIAYYKALLKDYTIKSPIDGVVIDRMREEGETVNSGTPILIIVDQAKLRVRAELEETDVGKAVVGQGAEVSCDAFPGKVFKGKVTKVLPAVKRKQQRTFDPTTSFDINTQEIQIKLDDYEGLERGMSVTVRFEPLQEKAQK
ncbi:MAG TPA: efflux RND transporter periplasmic adaptor subunit [Dissulfurispiraceae bacterium]|nr:efflux RND transporter periplasmic adaptor subunit [Dissulfurispiraceae bacterium]